MKNQLQPSLFEDEPNLLAGTVIAQYVRCGTPGCRCSRGQLHGPYYYRFRRENGKLKKSYVRLADLDHIRARCDLGRKRRSEHQRALQNNQMAWHQMSLLLRDLEKQA